MVFPFLIDFYYSRKGQLWKHAVLKQVYSESYCSLINGAYSQGSAIRITLLFTGAQYTRALSYASLIF